MTEKKSRSIFERLLDVMAEVGAIGKGQENKFDKYKFRGIDDVYNALHPALVKHGVIVAPEVMECTTDTYETAKGAVMRSAVLKVRYHFHGADNTTMSVVVMGEGADRGDKAINKAHSSAFKTALFQTLCIPTEEKSDSEHESPEARARKKTPAQVGASLLSATEARCGELDLAPSDYARGAINSIVRDLGIDKTRGADLIAGEQAILDRIRAWTPPPDVGDDFASGPKEKERTLGDNGAALRELHSWVGEEVGIRNSKAEPDAAHDALHASLPDGFESLTDLPLALVPVLKDNVRLANRQKGAA